MTRSQTFTVPEISCERCVSAITGEVSQVMGVDSVDVNIEAKAVTVIGGERTAIIAAIDDAGYDIAEPARQSAVAETQIDNGVIRVTKWTFLPGTETGPHVHEFDYVVVPVQGGELTIEGNDGATSRVPIELGVSYNREKGVAHNVINQSDSTIAFVEVELLDR